MKKIGRAMRYRKDLSNSTSIRLSNGLRSESQHQAKFKGLSFSEFVRASLHQNIKELRGAKAEVNKKKPPKNFD